MQTLRLAQVTARRTAALGCVPLLIFLSGCKAMDIGVSFSDHPVVMVYGCGMGLASAGVGQGDVKVYGLMDGKIGAAPVSVHGDGGIAFFKQLITSEWFTLGLLPGRACTACYGGMCPARPPDIKCDHYIHILSIGLVWNTNYSELSRWISGAAALVTKRPKQGAPK